MSKQERLLLNYPRPYLTELDLEAIFDKAPDSRHGKVKRFLAKGYLTHVRRGLYCLTEKTKLNPFELAQYIYGPSYISLESALSYHGLIPEAVYTTTSVSTKRAKEFKTPLGVFSYQPLPLANFYMEVSRITENDSVFYMAKPWKAICDYVYCYKKNWQNLMPLEESLRIDLESLPVLNDETLALLNEYYHHSRIECFLKGVTKT